MISRPWIRRTPSLALGLIALIVAACHDSPTETKQAPRPRVLAAKPRMHGPIFVALEIQLDHPGDVEVLYWASDVDTLRVVASEAAESHSLALPRLRADRDYSFAIAAMGEGSTEPLEGTFRTGALPASLQGLEMTSEGERTFPLLYLSYASPDDFNGGVIFDDEDRVVWYFETELSIHGMAHRASGNFVLNTREGLVEVDPLGREVARLPAAEVAAHHEVIMTPRNTLLFLGLEQQDVDGEQITGEAIWEWSPELDLKEKRWSAFDHLSWTDDRGARSTANDWLHANALSIGPRGNVLVSFHFLDQVASIRSDFGGFEWRLGGVNGDFALPEDAVFSGQHTAAEVLPGRVLMFDNGFARPGGGPWSRALELAIDAETGTAERVWEYRPNPDIWARIISSARRLENGHTLVTFGTAQGVVGSTGPIAVHEVTSAGNPVWTLEVGSPAQFTFRGEALVSIAGEERP